MNQPDISESLLTEILLHVQALNASVEDFNKKLVAISRDIQALETKVDGIIEHGFVNKDLKAHKDWHENANNGFLRHIFGRK